MKLYLVGGTVRNFMLGEEGCEADMDFAVEAESYGAMRNALAERGLKVWQERPEFVTLRGHITLDKLGEFGGLLRVTLPRLSRERVFVDADFTLCRLEAQYSDRRHPDSVTPCDIRQDLTRRDFTVNAVAVAEDGTTVDPHQGSADADNRTLRTVGPPSARFAEDPLRMLRAVRFMVRHGLWPAENLRYALNDYGLVALLRTLPHERVREELNKALRHNWRWTMIYLLHDFPKLGNALHEMFPNLWLKATTEER